jgi:hypothetical protein
MYALDPGNKTASHACPGSLRVSRARIAKVAQICHLGAGGEGPQTPAGLTRRGREEASYQARQHHQHRDADAAAIGLHM